MTDTPTVPARKPWLRDMLERVVATFAMAFLALYVPAILGGGGSLAVMADLGILDKAAFAGVAAVLSLVKALIAKKVGDSESASLDPAV